MQNSDFRTRITSLYWSQTSPMFFCIQNSDFSTRIASLYGSQPSPVVFSCKTSCLDPELIVSMCPRPHLSFCACKTEWLAPELLDSVGPSPHLRILHAKQRLLDRNYKSLRVSDFDCWLSECTTACLEPEWRLSISPTLHLWFCAFTTAI